MGSKRGLREEENMTIRKTVRQALTGAIAIAAMATLPGSAYAAPITGFLAIGGGITYDTVDNTGGAIIDWSPSGGGTGTVVSVTDATGYFNPDGAGVLGLDFLDTMTIRDLTNTAALAGPVPAPAYAPPGATVEVENFLSNPTGVGAALSGLHFDLTERVVQTPTAELQPCDFTEGLGDQCILGDIFILSQSQEGLRIALDVRGYFRNGMDEGYFTGGFSTTFTDLTFQEAYARILAGENLDCPAGVGTGRVPCSFDANFTNAEPIPEPASLLLFGTGSTLLALRRRRNKK
jgi:hypothetical protein